MKNYQFRWERSFRDRSNSAVKELFNVEKKKGASGTRSGAKAVNIANCIQFLDVYRGFSK